MREERHVWPESVKFVSIALAALHTVCTYIHHVCIFDGIKKSYLQDVKLKVLGDQSFRLAAVIY